MVWAKDPKRIYSIEEAFEENQMNVEADKPTSPKYNPNKYQNIKYPILREDAKITIKRDKNLMIKAGGYSMNKAYLDLSSYANMGLI